MKKFSLVFTDTVEAKTVPPIIVALPNVYSIIEVEKEHVPMVKCPAYAIIVTRHEKHTILLSGNKKKAETWKDFIFVAKST